MNPIDAQFPDKLQFLFQPARYKVLWGGRGGAKSWGIARALLILGAMTRLRIVCGREIQKSIKDSVLALLAEQIVALGLQAQYSVQKTCIVGRNGTLITFVGLKHNTNSLKSLEGCDIFWLEEAQACNKASWAIVIPTIRKPGSEIWVSFNPGMDTDETYRRFVVSPSKRAKVVKIGWQDNPWFPEELRMEKDELKESDPVSYEQVWEGAVRSTVDGAIYAAEIIEAEKEKRIGTVPRDRTRPVDTFWDLGFGDSTAIWFAQAMPDGTIRVVDYLESAGKTIEWYVIQLNNKGYMYGQDWLPHDGVDMIIHAKLGANTTQSIEMLLRQAGRRPRLVPKTHIHTGINGVRTIFPKCWFDKEKCNDGLHALRNYQWTPTTKGGVESRIPLHNHASHGADAFRTLAFACKIPETAPPPAVPIAPGNEHSWMG